MALHADHDLLQAYLDGALTADDRARLEVRLRCQPDLSDALVILAQEEAICSEWAAAHAAADAVLDKAQVAPTDATLIRSACYRSRRPRRVALALAATAAAVLLAVVGVYVSRPGPNSAGSILALLEEVQGDVVLVSADGEARNAEAGQAVYPGQEIRTGEEGSSTVIRLLDSRLVLASDTHVRLGREGPVTDASWPLVFVTEGIVSAELAPRPDGRPMIISSPLAELRGSAGRFKLASLPEKTLIESDEGTARVIRKSDGKSLEVKRGHYAIAAHNEPFSSQNMAARWTTPKRSFAETGPIVGLFFDPDGISLVLCAGDSIKRRDLKTGRVTSTIQLQTRKKPPRAFAASNEGNMFAAAPSDERPVRLFDAISGAERAAFKGLKRPVAQAFSADGRLLAVSWSAGKEGHELRLYDTALGLDRLLPTGHTGAVQALSFSGHGKFLATAADRSIRLWNADNFILVRPWMKLSYEPRCVAFSPDERVLAVGDRKGGIHLLDVPTGADCGFLGGHLRDVTALAFAPGGQTLLSASADGTARLWDMTSNREIATLKTGNQPVNAVAFSQDGLMLGTGGADRKVALWDAPAAGQ